MATAVSPTKANLMAAKKSLALAETGYSLLDPKEKYTHTRNYGPYRLGQKHSGSDRPKL